MEFDENVKVLMKIPPPALHVCLLGPTNDIIKHLQKVYPGVREELEKLYVVKENYHGKTFEGNQTK